MVIHAFDDYPIHQSSAPVMHPVSDSLGVYDRYFYNGYDNSGTLFFAVALGVYPNRRVMDASFCVLVDGVQHNVRSSRRCDTDRTKTSVGSTSIEVIRPMLEHRVTVSGHGIEADLIWRAESPVLEEPPFKHNESGRTTMDYTRITQLGFWSGWVSIDDRRFDLAEFGRVAGCRDRSWGSRSGSKGLGAPESDRQFFWLWAPGSFRDHHVHAAVNEDVEGRAWHRSGAIAARFASNDSSGDRVLDESFVQRCTSAQFEIEWLVGTRWPGAARVTLERWRAEPLVIDYAPKLRFQMSGLGYTHRDWWHGAWRGELDETRDSIDSAIVNPLDPTMIHVQQVCQLRCGDEVGIGILESLAIGPHEPSGFRSSLDGAMAG